MTAVDAQVVSRARVTTLKLLRSDNEFNLFWNKVKQFAEKRKVNDPHLPRRKISLIVIWLVKLEVNTHRISRKNIEGNIRLLLIS